MNLHTWQFTHTPFYSVREGSCQFRWLRLLPRDGKFKKKKRMSPWNRLTITEWVIETGSNGLELRKVGWLQGLQTLDRNFNLDRRGKAGFFRRQVIHSSHCGGWSIIMAAYLSAVHRCPAGILNSTSIYHLPTLKPDSLSESFTLSSSFFHISHIDSTSGMSQPSCLSYCDPVSSLSLPILPTYCWYLLDLYFYNLVSLTSWLQTFTDSLLPTK